MKRFAYLTPLLVAAACTQSPQQKIVISNPSDFQRKQVVSVDVSEKAWPATGKEIQNADGTIVPSEWIDANGDGLTDELKLVAEVKAGVSLELIVSESSGGEPVKMTQAEISVKEGGAWQGQKYIGGEFVNQTKVTVPESHTDHSYWIRYEGPGWESDMVAYRSYLDWRNGVDIFGKTTSDMVLQNVGQDGFDSYHVLSDWGMDVLKVGYSLGMGAIGRFQNDSLYRFQNMAGMSCEITKNGNLESVITTKYDSWVTEEDTVSLVSKLSIQAASRVTKHEVAFDQPLTGFCTGLVRSKDEEYIQLEEGDYLAIATHGKYSLNGDNLGMAVLAKKEDIASQAEPDHSHVLVFKPAESVTYYFLAAWELEPNGVKDVETFKKYLSQELIKLNTSLNVSLPQ
ncbi:DUF4861 domain-containing protein [Marinoscillum sp. MHG1-6]|uniref:DUF4861 domain-containing protein n=1 Tax=Marinoscillum sp. MHG1-6 TaxID=2959627 RepID=UPI002157BEA6|nr:DUF4861 domain-containing protein [Marinoscillum sp. MHG1-6]